MTEPLDDIDCPHGVSALEDCPTCDEGAERILDTMDEWERAPATRKPAPKREPKEAASADDYWRHPLWYAAAQQPNSGGG